MTRNLFTRRPLWRAAMAALVLTAAACGETPSSSATRADLKQTPVAPAKPEAPPPVRDRASVSTLAAQARATPEAAAETPAAPVEAPAKSALPTAPSAAGKPSAPARPVADAELAAQVKSAVLAQPLSALMFNVNVSNGVVTLSGTADSNETREKAARAAANVAGVKSVNNRINVLSGS